MSSTMQPHDRLIRDLLSNTKRAAQYLTSVLPSSITEAYDFERLRRVPTDFVTPRFREKRVDMLLFVPRRGAAAGDRSAGLLLYVLFEHLSTPDPLTPLRLLGYQVTLWEQWLRDLPREHSRVGLRLPPILPLVLYQGKATWTVAPDMQAMLNLDGLQESTREALMPYLVNQRYMLQNLGTTRDEDIGPRGMVRVTLLMMKHIKSRDILRVLASLQQELAEEIANDRAGEAISDLHEVRMVLRYILMASEYVDTRQLADAVEPLGEQIKEIAVTEGERLIATGFRKGLEEGLEKGRREERLSMARNLLREGMAPETVARLTKLPLSQVKGLALS